MALRVYTVATGEPVTVTEQKIFSRLSTVDTTEDALLGSLITAARQNGENLTGRAWMPQTFQLTLDSFPSGGISVPMPPMSSTAADVEITYVDEDGISQTLAATAISVDYTSEPGFISPSYDNEWPNTREQLNAVTVLFKAGYPISGGSTTTTPEAMKTWLKMRVSQMYEYREAMQPGIGFSEMPHSYVDGLLDPFVLIDLRP